MATLADFEKVFGKLIPYKEKENKENNMEITSKILNVSDKYPNKRSFQIIIDSKEEWASFWYSGKQGQAQSSVVQMVKSLNKGDEATFEVKQNGRWWNINHIMPHKDVNADVNADVNEDPGPTELPQDPEREATQMAEQAVDKGGNYGNNLSLKDVIICSQVAIKEGFETFRSAMSATTDVKIDDLDFYCDKAMDKIIENFNRYSGK